jgi:hypothetical protein
MMVEKGLAIISFAKHSAGLHTVDLASCELSGQIVAAKRFCNYSVLGCDKGCYWWAYYSVAVLHLRTPLSERRKTPGAD